MAEASVVPGGVRSSTAQRLVRAAAAAARRGEKRGKGEEALTCDGRSEPMGNTACTRTAGGVVAQGKGDCAVVEAREGRGGACRSEEGQGEDDGAQPPACVGRSGSAWWGTSLGDEEDMELEVKELTEPLPSSIQVSGEQGSWGTGQREGEEWCRK